MVTILRMKFLNAPSGIKVVGASMKISLFFVPKVLINGKPALVPMKARQQLGDKPLSGSKKVLATVS